MSQLIKHFSLAFVLVVLVSCRTKAPEDEGETTQNDSPTPTTVVESNWPVARGGAGLSGQVGFALPVGPEVKWTFKSTGGFIGEAVVADGKVIVGDSAGFLTALDLKSGEQCWQVEFDQSFEAAPAIYNDTIYIGCEDYFLYALNLHDGQEKWSIETDDKITAAVNLTKSPVSDEMWIVLNGYDGVCRALKASNGQQVWVRETDSPINGTPAIVDGKFVVFGGCDHYLYTLDLATGEPLKKIEGDAPIVSTVGTEGSFVAWANHANQVMGADINAGVASWTYSDRSFPFMSAPAVDQLRVYIGGRDKKIHAINRLKGTQDWVFKTGSRVESSPLLFNNGLLCGSSDGRLYALSLDQGQEIWSLDLGESLVASPSFASGRILIGSEDGTLFAVGSK
jgi:outer membrane protein assembly factor BamB